MTRRILITGGSGFIGTNAVEHFSNSGAEVLSLDTNSPRNPKHADRWKAIDLLDREELTDAVTEFSPSDVLHLGARTDLDGATLEDYPANIDGVSNLLNALRSTDAVRRVVFASSRLVCEIGYQPTDEFDVRPTTAYGESKVEGERIVRAATDLNFDWCVIRPTSIWGPWFDVPYRNFFDAVLAGRYLHPKGRAVLKSFGYVGNSVHQLERLLDCDADQIRGRTFFFGDYQPLDVLAWANEIARQASVRPVREVPMGVLRTAALAGDGIERWTGKHAPLTTFRLNNLVTEMVYDMAPIENVVGPTPFDLSSGIKSTLAWLNRHSPAEFSDA